MPPCLATLLFLPSALLLSYPSDILSYQGRCTTHVKQLTTTRIQVCSGQTHVGICCQQAPSADDTDSGRGSRPGSAAGEGSIYPTIIRGPKSSVTGGSIPPQDSRVKREKKACPSCCLGCELERSQLSFSWRRQGLPCVLQRAHEEIKMEPTKHRKEVPATCLRGPNV